MLIAWHKNGVQPINHHFPSMVTWKPGEPGRCVQARKHISRILKQNERVPIYLASLFHEHIDLMHMDADSLAQEVQKADDLKWLSTAQKLVSDLDCKAKQLQRLCANVVVAGLYTCALYAPTTLFSQLFYTQQSHAILTLCIHDSVHTQARVLRPYCEQDRHLRNQGSPVGCC
jgi:hypothetical protein